MQGSLRSVGAWAWGRLMGRSMSAKRAVAEGGAAVAGAGRSMEAAAAHGSTKKGGGSARSKATAADARPKTPVDTTASSEEGYMVTYGLRGNRMTFRQHPAVMALARLLDLHDVCRPRVRWTEETVRLVEAHDPVLGAKARLAWENDLVVCLSDIEHLHRPEWLARLVRERDQLAALRKELATLPPDATRLQSPYDEPRVPRAWLPPIPEQFLKANPEVRKILREREAELSASGNN